MEPHIIAYCGLDCSKCDAYKATQACDPEMIERVVTVWREQYDPDVTAETLLCDGCLVDEGRRFTYCAECPIRACCRAKGLSSCAQCASYDECETLREFLDHAPELQHILDEIHASSMGSAAD
ncbi:MAG: DUF3795 domain-containing protein [Anaerolineae bacterium]